MPSIFSFVKTPVKRKAADDMKRYERRKSAVKQKQPLAADQCTSQNLAPNLQHLDHPGSHSDNEEHGDTTPSLDLALAESDEPEHPYRKRTRASRKMWNVYVVKWNFLR